MGKYIKLFNSHSDYEDFVETTDFVLPNVSRCDSEKDVHYTPKPYDYSQDYLTFDIISDGTLTWGPTIFLGTSGKSIAYSIDEGENWVNVSGSSSSTTFLNAVSGQKILFKGSNSSYYDTRNGESTSFKFSGTASFNISGNIMSMIDGDNFKDIYSFSGNDNFAKFFSSCNVIDTKNLILPATTLTSNCYNSMFYNCTNLISTPKLPAETLAYQCYANMFNACSSLTTAPKLMATTLANYCYSYMFYNCTSLTTVQKRLPATVLEGFCYMNMFNGCTSLTTAPELPAITLVSNCYLRMFYNCTNLSYIKAMFTSYPGGTYTDSWVENVASSGTFVKNSVAPWTITGNSAVPSGWTVVTADS